MRFKLVIFTLHNFGNKKELKQFQDKQNVTNVIKKIN